MYSISDVAQFFNISTQTLRYYDQIGLLTPGYIAPKTRYRYYRLEDFNTLYLIRELKNLNFTLGEIQEYCRTKDTHKLEAALEGKQRQLEREIEALQRTRSQVDHYRAAIRLSHSGNRESLCEIRTLPERYAYMIAVNFGMEELSEYISMAYRSYLSAPDSRQPCERGHIVLRIRRDNFRKKQFRTYSGIGFLTDRPAAGEHAAVFPGGMWAVLPHVGAYDTIHRSYQRLYRYLSQAGYEPIGDATEVSVTNVTLTSDPQQFITELQIPVGKTETL